MDESVFSRGLDDYFVQELNNLYKDVDSYWRRFVDDPDLFLAIRDNYINFYYLGNSLLRLEWKSASKCIVGQIHYKYLLKPNLEGREYAEIKNGETRLPKPPDELFSKTIEDLDALKRASGVYSGDEKTGVHQIAMKNPLVLDLEIAFGGGGSAPRIDLAAIQVTNDAATLVFYEAKHFSNSELRAQDEPKVLQQLATYSKLLEVNREAIEKSYKTVCNNLCNLAGVNDQRPERNRMLQGLGDGFQLCIDPEPRLLVFGFDSDQKNGKVWRKHRDKLRDHRKLKCWGNAENVRLDW